MAPTLGMADIGNGQSAAGPLHPAAASGLIRSRAGAGAQTMDPLVTVTTTTAATASGQKLNVE
jgi:hypothetical protein